MPRIMLVDDDLNTLRTLGRIIHFLPAGSVKGQVEVEYFERPELALMRAAECDFDVVITSYLMLHMTGVEFLNRLIAIQPNISRLMMSGVTEIRESMAAIDRFNLFHLIYQPCSNEDLRRLLIAVLEYRNLTMPLRSSSTPKSSTLGRRHLSLAR